MFNRLQAAKPIVGCLCRIRPSQAAALTRPFLARPSSLAVLNKKPLRLAYSTTTRKNEDTPLFNKIKAELDESEAVIHKVRADLRALAKSNPELHQRLKESIQREHEARYTKKPEDALQAGWVSDALWLGFLFD